MNVHSNSESQLAQDKMLALTGRALKLPPLPTVSSELLTLARQPLDKIDVHQLSALIERDQALTAAILKLVNSPYYGRSRTITQVGRALTMVGLGDALSYLNFFLMRSLMPVFPHLPHLTQNSYFQHSWATAVVARQLGRPQLLIQSMPGELYLAGLMHDLGKVVLAAHLSDRYAEVLERSHNESRALADVEQQLLDFDHAMLGAHLLDEWNLPTSILDAVAFHHRPEQAAPEHQELAALIQLADVIANQSGVGSAGNPVRLDFKETWIHRHGATQLSDAVTLDALVMDVQAELRAQAQVLDYLETEAPAPHVQEVLPASGGAPDASSSGSRGSLDASAPSGQASSSAAVPAGLFRRFANRIGSMLRA